MTKLKLQQYLLPGAVFQSVLIGGHCGIAGDGGAIVALVARGYSLIAYGFLIPFAAPLLTRELAIVMKDTRR